MERVGDETASTRIIRQRFSKEATNVTSSTPIKFETASLDLTLFNRSPGCLICRYEVGVRSKFAIVVNDHLIPILLESNIDPLKTQWSV